MAENKRLLTDEEEHDALRELLCSWGDTPPEVITAIKTAQDAKTARIVRADTIKEVFERLEELGWDINSDEVTAFCVRSEFYKALKAELLERE